MLLKVFPSSVLKKNSIAARICEMKFSCVGTEMIPREALVSERSTYGLFPLGTTPGPSETLKSFHEPIQRRVGAIEFLPLVLRSHATGVIGTVSKAWGAGK